MTPSPASAGVDVSSTGLVPVAAPFDAPEPLAPDVVVRAAHFQIYADAGRRGGHWRLLSGNHRELGRSVTVAGTVAEVSLDIRDIRDRLPGARAVVRPVEGHRWEWRLVDDAGTLAVSGHAFDRKLRCTRAAEQFVVLAADAPVARNVIAAGSRRGARAQRTVTRPF